MDGVSGIFPVLIAACCGVGAGIFWARKRASSSPTPVTTPEAEIKKEPPPDIRHGFVSLAETLREIVFVLDEKDRLIYFNEPAHTLPGIKDAALGKDVALLIRSADFLDQLRQVRAGKIADSRCEVFLRRPPGGGDIALETAFAPLPDTGRFGPNALAIIMTDISRMRRLENIRKEFVANVSHDLRTPVTIVKGAAHMLVEDYDSMSDTDRRRFLEKIQRNTQRLHVLLEDLLELTNLEESGAPGLNLATGRLHSEVASTCDSLAEKLAGIGVSIEYRFNANDTLVAIDAPKFSRVIQNLIENTLRYATGATRLRFLTEIRDGLFLLRMEDDGPGLAHAEYEKVFERFYRSEKSRSTAGGGSGLGLSIVKHIVLAHAGTVRAEPARPKGFAVEITLPLAAE